MISAVRTNKPQRGFTLIEIVMVLAISAIVMGGAIGLMIFSSDERVLRNASGEIELLAKRARTIAILNQTPYALEFREGVVRLCHSPKRGWILKSRPTLRTTRGRGRNRRREPAGQPWKAEWKFPSAAGTPTNGSPRLKKPCMSGASIRTAFASRFPSAITLEKSWAEDTYHPLTATISESALEAR